MDGEPEFEIAKVLDSKIDHWCSKYKLLYLIHWTRYAGTDEETSWILALELRNAPELISDFHQLYLAKPGPLGQLYNFKATRPRLSPMLAGTREINYLRKLRCHTFLISHSIIFYLR